MDELTISGRRYISSRRLAKEHGYHSDYIGQLIRGNKVVGQKVGRAWYVDAASFDAYLGKESPAEAPALAEAPAPMHAVAEAPAASADSAGLSEPEEENKNVYSKKEEENIEIKINHQEDAREREQDLEDAQQTQPAGLRYYADDEPLMPRIPTKQAPVFAARVSEDASIERESETQMEREALSISTSRRVSAWRPRHTVGLAVLGGVTLALAAAASSAAYLRINADGQTASASYGFDLTYPASFITSVK